MAVFIFVQVHIAGERKRGSCIEVDFSDLAQFSERPSRNGNYTAFTIVETVGSAEDVFARYETASAIKGIIAL